jgi:hypothetical protein
MAAADPELRIERLEAALRMASRELQWANLTIQKKDAEILLLQERLRKQRIGFLGPVSETLSDLQLEFLTEEEPGVTRAEVEAESQRESIPAAPPRKRKPHPGRKPLPESLPRVEEVIACEANCTHCGGETRVIGYVPHLEAGICGSAARGIYRKKFERFDLVYICLSITAPKNQPSTLISASC